MWEKSYSVECSGVSKKAIWDLWSNPNAWPKWNGGVEKCVIAGPVTAGTFFTLKPKGGPVAKLQFLEVTQEKSFTDVTYFVGAKMYGIHTLEELSGGSLKLTCTMKVEGWLSFVWIHIVAKNIVKELPQDLGQLIACARKLDE